MPFQLYCFTLCKQTNQPGGHPVNKEPHNTMFNHNLRLLALAVMAFIIAGLMSCSNKSYSPIDTYINTSIKSSEENYKSASQAKAFIDSLNAAGVKAINK